MRKIQASSAQIPVIATSSDVPRKTMARLLNTHKESQLFYLLACFSEFVTDLNFLPQCVL